MQVTGSVAGTLGFVTLLPPALGALLLGLVPLGRRAQGLIGCGSIFLAFLAAGAMALAHGFGAAPAAHPVDARLGVWAAAGSLRIPLGVWVDGLSAVFCLVVTGVGFLIHVYSLAYMAGEADRDWGRYFAGMNVFVAAMLLLVLADSYPLLLVGWAGVGFASYYLIGFWYERPAAVAAARKAFVLNAVGDAGFVLAIALLALGPGRVGFGGLFLGGGAQALARTPSLAVGVGLLLYVAAAAKSAQLPLHSWLSDAMEGPTPVSALIHAATMVTAGAYLIARSAPLFAAAPGAAATAGYLGALTALAAAGMGLASYDLKRVLAYSTMSQVGYMVAAVSFGALAAGVAHVVTHAFFKALLFMVAGIVMHATADERDMRRYGGLARELPLARWGFLVGALALAGVFPLAGFWSKDAILGDLLGAHPVAWVLLALAALLTPFYAFRAYYLTFAGGYRGQAPVHRDVPAAMAWPTWVLAILSALGGALAVPLERGWGQGFDLGAAALSLALALVGWGAAWLWYREGAMARDAWTAGALGQALRAEYGWEALWRAVLVRPGEALAAWLVDAWEGRAWPAAEAALAGAARALGGLVGAWQDGALRRYALSIFCGAGLVLLWALVAR
jgi:NADH-quinone oxidoreductase subunit L